MGIHNNDRRKSSRGTPLSLHRQMILSDVYSNTILADDAQSNYDSSQQRLSLTLEHQTSSNSQSGNQFNGVSDHFCPKGLQSTSGHRNDNNSASHSQSIGREDPYEHSKERLSISQIINKGFDHNRLAEERHRAIMARIDR